MCDETRISAARWGDLKEKAMEPDYLKKSPFARYLSKNEKETLKILIEKQTAQGDMLPLKPKNYEEVKVLTETD